MESLIRRFQTDFSWDPESPFDEERLAWITVHALSARQWEARGDAARPGAEAARARGLISAPDSIRDARLVAALRTLDPATPAPASRYDFAALFHPAGDSR